MQHCKEVCWQAKVSPACHACDLLLIVQLEVVIEQVCGARPVWLQFS